MKTLTITSKNQVTIPSSFSKEMKLKKGQLLVIEKRLNSLILTPAELMVKKLSGSVKVSKKIRDMDKIITQAKKKHFAKKPR